MGYTMEEVEHKPVRDIEQTLRLLQARPHLFVGDVTLERIYVWLGGFGAGCAALGEKIDRDAYVKVLEGRGWAESAYGEIPQMRKKGLSDEQIIRELIEIQILTYRSEKECRRT